MLTELLSRIQFAFTISFHIIFPAFSIGLATFLFIMEALWLKTNESIYLNIAKYWTKVFALTFGMGVVSGIIMEFQLGTNWAGFSEKVGPVLGALFTYEVLTAFFIEAGALGIMLFGWGRVNKYVHLFSTFIIFVGVTVSAFWIVAANSWMQTPSGVVYEDNRFIITSWYNVVFNPSAVPRYIHMLLASYLSTLLMVTGISAYYLLENRHHAFAKKCLTFGISSIFVLGVIQGVIGDAVGLIVREHQPIKTAAIEGIWHTQTGVPFVLFAYPDMVTESNKFAIEIPKLSSLINTHTINGELIGLTSVPRADRPYVPIVFYSFRIMVGVGLIIIFIGLVGIILKKKNKLSEHQTFLKILVLCSPIGFIALLAGWFTAETGRQPWVVYNMIRTSSTASQVSVWEVITSMIIIFIVYMIVFCVFYLKYLFMIIRKGPYTKGEERMPFSYFQSVEHTVEPEKEDK